MRILITNDDGYRSRGIGVLAAAVAAAGHDIVVAAPMRDQSGCGAGIGQWYADEHIEVADVTLDDAPDVRAIAVDGTPALAVFAANLGAFGDPPDVVVSGINPGLNTGRATLHSGTVGAVLTAANLGLSGLAVSQDYGDPLRWDTAATLAVDLLEWLDRAPPKTVLNLNVPNTPLDEVLGVRWASLAPFGSVRAAVADSGEGHIQMEFREVDEELPPGSDTALVVAGYAALSSLVGIRVGEPLTEDAVIERSLRRTA
jgi:5'/3'-nucleotidase